MQLIEIMKPQKSFFIIVYSVSHILQYVHLPLVFPNKSFFIPTTANNLCAYPSCIGISVLQRTAIYCFEIAKNNGFHAKKDRTKYKSGVNLCTQIQFHAYTYACFHFMFSLLLFNRFSKWKIDALVACTTLFIQLKVILRFVVVLFCLFPTEKSVPSHLNYLFEDDRNSNSKTINLPH